MAIYEPRSRRSPDTEPEHASTLLLEFQPQEMKEELKDVTTISKSRGTCPKDISTEKVFQGSNLLRTELIRVSLCGFFHNLIANEESDLYLNIFFNK